MKDIKITLLWRPKSTQHIYSYHWKIKYMLKDAKLLKKSYIEQVEEQYKWEIITDFVEIDIKLYFNDKRKRDFDNYHKISIDSLSWTVLEDDVLIKRAIIEKFIDKENPRIEFIIKEYKEWK